MSSLVEVVAGDKRDAGEFPLAEQGVWRGGDEVAVDAGAFALLVSLFLRQCQASRRDDHMRRTPDEP